MGRGGGAGFADSGYGCLGSFGYMLRYGTTTRVRPLRPVSVATPPHPRRAERDRRGTGAARRRAVPVGVVRVRTQYVADLSAGNNVPGPHDRGRCEHGARLIIGPLPLLSILTLEIG